MLTSFPFDFHLANDIKYDSQYYPPLSRNVLTIFILVLSDVAVILHLSEGSTTFQKIREVKSSIFVVLARAVETKTRIKISAKVHKTLDVIFPM